MTDLEAIEVLRRAIGHYVPSMTALDTLLTELKRLREVEAAAKSVIRGQDNRAIASSFIASLDNLRNALSQENEEVTWRITSWNSPAPDDWVAGPNLLSQENES